MLLSIMYNLHGMACRCSVLHDLSWDLKRDGSRPELRQSSWYLGVYWGIDRLTNRPNCSIIHSTVDLVNKQQNAMPMLILPPKNACILCLWLPLYQRPSCGRPRSISLSTTFISIVRASLIMGMSTSRQNTSATQMTIGPRIANPNAHASVLCIAVSTPTSPLTPLGKTSGLYPGSPGAAIGGW